MKYSRPQYTLSHQGAKSPARALVPPPPSQYAAFLIERVNQYRPYLDHTEPRARTVGLALLRHDLTVLLAHEVEARPPSSSAQPEGWRQWLATAVHPATAPHENWVRWLRRRMP